MFASSVFYWQISTSLCPASFCTQGQTCLLLQISFDFLLLHFSTLWWKGFPASSEVKASACNAQELGSIPGLGRSPGQGNGNPLQYSCLENPMDRGAWWATLHGVAKSWTQLSDFTFTWWKGHLWGGGISSRKSCRSSLNYSTSASLALVVGAYTWITMILNGLPWKWTEIGLFWDCTQVLHFGLFCGLRGLLHFF